MAAERVGIVGTGRMGANIARRLKEVGYEVPVVYDINPEHARLLADEIGADACRSLAGITEGADVIVTVVSDDAAMFSIFAEVGDSLLAPDRPQIVGGKYFINCATVTPAVHREVERLCNARAAHSIEACMASSIPQARNGTLYLMCGGKKEDFEHVRPLLEKMSSSLRYVGPAGKAAEVKALVNMVMNVNTAGLAEGLGLGQALGLDLTMLREVFGQTGAASRVLETDGADMQNRDHDCYFSATHAAKDSGIALGLARESGVDLPLAQATFEQYERMKRLGLGELDKSGVSELTFKERAAEHKVAG
ncbi:MAG TPA: NAD(P)-dependent oxidoreductase [Candidatus Baltobacteraceae bacterium]|jgi:3-hydroxyisobutyrate dehydrogenase|nr:NAD(P)-dependent oxidoreductase [Candidatus Baltobacteraceae bacterium]